MTFTLPSSSKLSASSQGPNLGVRHANSSSLLISNLQELFTCVPSLHRLLIARVAEPSAVAEEYEIVALSSFFLTVKEIPFPPRGFSFLTKKHRLFNKVKHHSLYSSSIVF